MGKEELKEIADRVIGTSTIVEATLEPKEFYIYTEVWTLDIEQLEQIRKDSLPAAVPHPFSADGNISADKFRRGR